MRSVEGRFGTIWYYGKDEYVGKSLHNYGEFSGEECEEILSLADPSKLCIDIGANIGVMSQMFEKNNIKCVAFEPQPEIFKLLRKNFSGEAHNCALGAEIGEAFMPRLRYGTRLNYGGVSLNTKSELGSYPVPVTTLDSYNFTNVGFIKIDVEGFEKEVLKGAQETIRNSKPIMYIEDDRPKNTKELREYITSLGYVYTESNTPLFRENNFLGKKMNVWAPNNYVSCNLVCKPIL